MAEGFGGIGNLPLFGDPTPTVTPSPTPEGGGVLTCFGEHVDRYARERGNWPDGVVVYLVEGINKDQALLTGEVPIGARKKDPTHPQFAPRKAKAPIYRVVITIDEWRAHCVSSPTLKDPSND